MLFRQATRPPTAATKSRSADQSGGSCSSPAGPHDGRINPAIFIAIGVVAPVKPDRLLADDPGNARAALSLVQILLRTDGRVEAGKVAKSAERKARGPLKTFAIMARAEVMLADDRPKIAAEYCVATLKRTRVSERCSSTPCCAQARKRVPGRARRARGTGRLGADFHHPLPQRAGSGCAGAARDGSPRSCRFQHRPSQPRRHPY